MVFGLMFWVEYETCYSLGLYYASIVGETGSRYIRSLDSLKVDFRSE